MQTRRPNTSLSIEILADLRSTSEFLDSLMLRSSNSPGRERVPQKLHARPIFERAPFFRGTDSASRGEVSSSRVRGVSTVPRKAFLSERSAKATRPAEVTGRRSSRRIDPQRNCPRPSDERFRRVSAQASRAFYPFGRVSLAGDSLRSLRRSQTRDRPAGGNGFR